ncbi:50S ribosomal protein L19 [Bdellovibrio sp. HCB185ZH]|uniref:50S ribosomal protein L19 n=1 Tax=Bdellovibrio sp. HCB185ZH TaxID=3394235 RepID=UPI0039A48754
MAKAVKKTVKTVKAKSEVKETNLVRRVSIKAANKSIQAFDSGDTVNVYVKVKEGEKERVQLYKGIVTKIQGAGAAKSFTVRKISAGVGVERTFPFNSPALDKVELVNVGKVRRSKLYFLRKLSGKAAKIESELVAQTATAAE